VKPVPQATQGIGTSGRQRKPGPSRTGSHRVTDGTAAVQRGGADAKGRGKGAKAKEWDWGKADNLQASGEPAGVAVCEVGNVRWEGPGPVANNVE